MLIFVFEITIFILIDIIIISFDTFQPQNERFVMKPVFLRGSTMVLTGGKILYFRVFESSKNELSRTFCSPNLSIESWILIVFARTFLNIHVK